MPAGDDLQTMEHTRGRDASRPAPSVPCARLINQATLVVGRSRVKSEELESRGREEALSYEIREDMSHKTHEVGGG